MHKIIYQVILILSFCFSTNAQSLFSIDDAIATALKNNFDILVAQNDADIAKINNAVGNAGMLPNVSLSAFNNYSIGSIDQEASSGVRTQASGVSSNNLNAGAYVTWTVFDGGKMFVTKRKLEQIELLGQIQFKDKVLQTIYSVTTAYYDVVRQKQLLMSINEVIAYNSERVNLLQTGFTAGLTVKTNLLQAQIDLNVYKENALAQIAVIRRSKRTLNQLLCRDANSVFEVGDSIPLSFEIDKQKLFETVLQNNTVLSSLKKQLAIAKLALQEAQTQRLPKISLNAGVTFGQINNSQGSILTNRTLGPQLGGSISVPLYQAGQISRQITIAGLAVKSAEYNEKNAEQQAFAELENALDDYETQFQLLRIEKENDAIAKENLDISMQRLRYGQATSLELRQAQESFEQSRTRLITIAYTLKATEAKIKQLTAKAL